MNVFLNTILYSLLSRVSRTCVEVKMLGILRVSLVVYLPILAASDYEGVPCDVRARTEAGWVCGLRRWSEGGKIYASFRGVPYAKQPVGELRFKELQPPEPWTHDFMAIEEGPVCIQQDEIYGYLTTQEYGMTDACIHANIHVPLYALPKYDKEGKRIKAWSKTERDEERTKFLSTSDKYYEQGSEFPLFKYDKNEEKITFDKTLTPNSQRYDDDKKPPTDPLNFIKNIGRETSSKPRLQYQNNEKEISLERLLKFQKGIDKNDYDWLKQYSKNNEVEKKNNNILLNPWSDQQLNNEPRFFWPYYEKPGTVKISNNSEVVKHILETWPKIQRQMQEMKNSPQNVRDKREKDDKNKGEEKLLPILVFIHGGGFNAGSGDADLHGPEYLVSKDVIVITFNFRINVFGFLYLNTPSIPGNNGLRDQITLLRWVQKNAKYFGGDPNNVTLMGQSTGATFAHLLSLSDAARGLFKRVWLMSGTAYESFYTTSPIYAAAVTANFLAILGIISVDPEEIHKELTQIPIKRIAEANSLIQAQFGLITFSPVVETRFPGITTVLDKDPETLIAEGKDREYEMVIGCTTVEAETFRRRLAYERYVSRVVANPRMLLPVKITFSTPPNVSLALGEKLEHRCFEKEPDLDGVVRCYSEAAFIYQAFRLARQRANMKSASTYLYQFSYESDLNLIQIALKLKYKGTGHIEDLTYVFRGNSLLEPKSDFPPKDRDDMMKDWMSAFVVNFMHCSDPTCYEKGHKSGWPPVSKDQLLYEDINTPYVFKVATPTHYLSDVITYYDKLYAMSGIAALNGTKLLN